MFRKKERAENRCCQLSNVSRLLPPTYLPTDGLGDEFADGIGVSQGMHGETVPTVYLIGLAS